MKKSVLLLLLVPVLLFSCKEDIEEPGSTGAFQSTFTGAIDKQFSGAAEFAHEISAQSTQTSSKLEIALYSVSNQNEVITLTLFNENKDGIATGTYLNSKGATTSFIPGYTDGVLTFFTDFSKTNTITLTDVKGEIVKGTFEINLIEIQSQRTIKIIGTFDAIGLTETN